MAGMHEVVVTNRTTDAIKRALEQNRSLWRVSSTVSECGLAEPSFGVNFFVLIPSITTAIVRRLTS